MKKYNKYFKNYKKAVIEEDWTTSHECQDEIYKKLVLDIVKNKLTFDEIKLIANQINKKIINGPPVTIWYA
jgi:hypothetical protein